MSESTLPRDLPSKGTREGVELSRSRRVRMNRSVGITCSTNRKRNRIKRGVREPREWEKALREAEVEQLL